MLASSWLYFLAAYTAVNAYTLDGATNIHFLAAYTAVNDP